MRMKLENGIDDFEKQMREKEEKKMTRIKNEMK